MKIIFFSIFLLSVTLKAEFFCSDVLFNAKTHHFKRGALKGRSMAYSLKTPSNWNGKTLVFIPGFGRNMHFWDEHAQVYFNKGYQTFRYDPFNIRRTLKANGVLENSDDLAFDDDIRAVSQILNKEKINSKISLIGHSLGSAKAVFLEIELNKRFKGRAVENLFIASPFVRFLSDYYNEKSAEDAARPFYLFNPWSGLPFLGSALDSYVDGVNDGIKGSSEVLIGFSSNLLESAALEAAVKKALDDRSLMERQEIGVSFKEEAAGLLEIMQSLTAVDVTKVVSRLKANVHLLTGDDDEVIVPQDLITELVVSAPKDMTHKIVKSDHFTPSKKSFFRWLNAYLK